jgi:hypothetical protein
MIHRKVLQSRGALLAAPLLVVDAWNLYPGHEG